MSVYPVFVKYILSLREEAVNEQGEPKVLPVTPFLRF
jgi:hypothetical protein